MPNYLTQIILDFSEDDLSDTTPTWQDVYTPYCKSIEWWSGVDSEGSEMQPGGAVIRLKNINRDWEPDYVAGRFYPNVTTHRRFRLRLNDGTGLTTEGLWYVTNIEIDYPADTAYSEVTITCADGFELLALDDLLMLDPPDADTYSDVVDFDEPYAYWRLGEFTAETKAGAVIRHTQRVRFKRRKVWVNRWTTRGPSSTTFSTPGSAGPTGTYYNTNLLAFGAPGAIIGDPDTAITCTNSGTTGGHMGVHLEDTNVMNEGGNIAIEAWVKQSGANDAVLTGPHNGGGNPIWLLRLASGSPGTFTFDVRGPGGTLYQAGGAAVISANYHHLVGVVEGTTMRCYVDGVLAAVKTYEGGIDSAAATPIVRIGRDLSTPEPFNGSIDEVALYEHSLTAERVLAHYTAGSARGYAQQTAGARIAEIVTNPLWSTASVQSTGRQVQPMMQHGQAKLEVISELMHAEGPLTLFFFNGSGDPVYLGHEWKAASSAYDTVQTTFGDGAGETRYDAVELSYDNETFNAVEASREGGGLVTVGPGSPPPRRVNPDYTDVLLTDDVFVESLAGHVLGLYEIPALRPVSITVNGAEGRAVSILDRQIGHLVRVKRRGQGGTPIDRVTHILGYRKALDAHKNLTCTYNLARGFNATPATGGWYAGIAGFSEAGVTTEAA